jgi:hypothetical protein
MQRLSGKPGLMVSPFGDSSKPDEDLDATVTFRPGGRQAAAGADAAGTSLAEQAVVSCGPDAEAAARKPPR